MSAVLGPDVGPYRVLRQLGAGGMGTVLLAEDTRLGRHVALKTFAGPEAEAPQVRHRLMREAQAAAALSHANIAGVHDVLDLEGRVVIVFEYVEGETLAARIARGPVPLPEALAMAAQLAEALDAAHARGIVHRDLKPSNVILEPSGRVKVLDFGIARVGPRDPATSVSPMTAGSALWGTPGYAPPEQWLEQGVDARADIYALGVVIFEMLAGERPFSGEHAPRTLENALHTEPPRLSTRAFHVPEGLDALVASMLAPDRVARPQSAREVTQSLEQVRQELSTQAEPRPTTLLPSPVLRRGAWPIAAIVALLALGGLGVWRLVAPSAPDAPLRPPVVAVLPLTNASGDASKDYVAAGIADSLVTSLASVPSMTVLSRAAVAEATSRRRDPVALAQDLDATYLVEGSVQQEGDRLRVTLNLLRPDASVAWGDSVEGLMSAVFDLQSRVAAAVANALEVRLSAEDRQRLAEQPTTNVEALGAYWQGRAILERRETAGNVDGAIQALEAAIQQDPRFADAHAALGEAYWVQWSATRDPRRAEQARQSGMRALELGPTRPMVRYSFARTLIESGRLDEGIAELRRALALQPNHEDARLQLGRALAKQGKVDEAIPEFRKAIALRPNHGSSYGAMGLSLYEAGRFDEAAQVFERAAALEPDNASAFQRLGTVYQAMGDDVRALANYEKALSLRPAAQMYSNMGAIFHSRKDYQRAVEAYQQAIALRPNSAATHRNLGDAYLRMGLVDAAKAAYREAVRLAETDLAVNPNDARNLAALSVYLQKAGDAQVAEGRLTEALALMPNDFDVLRRAAVVHALAGRTDAALDVLERAIKAGYLRSTARAEDDFEQLRAHPRFKALVAE